MDIKPHMPVFHIRVHELIIWLDLFMPSRNSLNVSFFWEKFHSISSKFETNRFRVGQHICYFVRWNWAKVYTIWKLSHTHHKIKNEWSLSMKMRAFMRWKICWTFYNGPQSIRYIKKIWILQSISNDILHYHITDTSWSMIIFKFKYFSHEKC